MEESVSVETTTTTMTSKISTFCEKEIISSYTSESMEEFNSSAAITSAAILTTKEINRLISESGLDASFLNAEADAENGNVAAELSPSPPCSPSIFPFGKPIFASDNEQMHHYSATDYPALEMDKEKDKNYSKSSTPTKQKQEQLANVKSRLYGISPIKPPKSTPTRKGQYCADTISSKRKALGSFPLPGRRWPSKSPEIQGQTESSFSYQEAKECEEIQPEPVQQSPEPEQTSKSKHSRPNSLQIPPEKNVQNHTTNKGATKCPAARKIKFDSASENSKKLGKILSKTEEKEKLEFDEENSANFVSVASQTRPCIVTPISAVKTLSAAEAVHRHNLFVYSNKTPSFLRSTESSRLHSISPQPRVIEEVKYLKDTSFLNKKSASLDCVAGMGRKFTTVGGNPRKLPIQAQIQQQTTKQPRKSTKQQDTQAQKHCVGHMVTIPPIKWASCTCSTTPTKIMPEKITTPSSKNPLNSSTYVSPIGLTSFTKYVDNLNNSNAKNKNERKLCPSKTMVTSISPGEAQVNSANAKRSAYTSRPSHSFSHFNTDKITTEKFKSFCNYSYSFSGGYSHRQGQGQGQGSPAERRVSDSAAGSAHAQVKSPMHHRFSVCSNKSYNPARIRMNSVTYEANGARRVRSPQLAMAVGTPDLPEYYTLQRIAKKSVK